jgi:predicted HD superfamily hydrolase involved in NAD metabolism
MNLDRYRSFVKEIVTPGRFQHSLRVMRVMGELASVYSLEQATAQVIGLLHDAAKDLTPADQLSLAEEANIPLYDMSDSHPLYLHGPVSAHLIAEELEVTDPIILDTISRHTYYGRGAARSPQFCWCLRFADVLEPQRDWNALKRQLRPLVYTGRMEEAALLQTQWFIAFFEEQGHSPVHPNMRMVCQELSAKLYGEREECG